MNIIISPLERDYNASYQVYTTLKDAATFSGTIDCLIYNEALDEPSLDLHTLFTIIKRADRVIYIRNDLSQNPVITMITMAKKGVVITDEMYLMNTPSLNALINSPRKDIDRQTVDENIITVLIGKLANNEALTKNYLQMTREALKGMLEESQNTQRSVTTICETACSLLEQEIEKGMEIQKQAEAPKEEGVIPELSKPENAVIDNWSMVKEETIGEGFQQAELIFTKKSYNVILVKDPEHTRFLLSFLAGLQHYMTVNLKIKTQLVVVEGVGMYMQEKYRDYKWITATNSQDLSKYLREDVLFIDFPESNLFKEILIDQQHYRARIVLDRTNYTSSHILKMDYPYAVKYGVQSRQTAKLLGLKPEQIITSCDDITDCEVNIKYNKNYSTDLLEAYDRKDYYYQTYEDTYEKLVRECPTIKDYS